MDKASLAPVIWVEIFLKAAKSVGSYTSHIGWHYMHINGYGETVFKSLSPSAPQCAPVHTSVSGYLEQTIALGKAKIAKGERLADTTTLGTVGEYYLYGLSGLPTHKSLIFGSLNAMMPFSYYQHSEIESSICLLSILPAV